MKFYIICSFVLFIFNGCTHNIDGNCNYQNFRGYAIIKSKKPHICIADFFPENNIWREWKQQDNTYNIEIPCSHKMKIGQTYPAILKKATYSSCTPTILSLGNK